MPGPPQAERTSTARLTVADGVCHVFFVYDIGLAIRLQEVQRALGAGGQSHRVVSHRRRTPEHFGYQHPPLRVVAQSQPIQVGSAAPNREAWSTLAAVECVLFEFGAVSVVYTIPLARPGEAEIVLEQLVTLGDALYENPALLADARQRVEAIVAQARDAIRKPSLSPLVEDYWVFHLRDVRCNGDAPAQLLRRPELLASILRSEPGPLSAQEVEDALACRISYAPGDLTIIDWNAALVVGRDMDDVLAVLEYANVELLEMRYLDEQLDGALEQTHSRQPVRGWRKLLGIGPSLNQKPMQTIAELQIDAATLFEEVNNSLKLLGDQYLARVYRLASQRLHLSEWDASILRKLDTLESIYEKMHNFATTRRLELLEWIVILLIAFEVVMSFVRP